MPIAKKRRMDVVGQLPLNATEDDEHALETMAYHGLAESDAIVASKSPILRLPDELHLQIIETVLEDAVAIELLGWLPEEA